MAGRASARAALATRQAILETAADLASVDGLEGMSIGRLADELSMSKSGVIGQFGSKEQLQLETVDLVLENFRRRVWEPVEHLEPGLPRLLGICRSWVEYAASPGYRGGCAVVQMTFEFDGRTGPVRDKVAAGIARWRQALVRDITTAVEAGDLPTGTDPDQAAFGLDAVASGITPSRMLHGNEHVVDWGVRSMLAILGLPPDKAPAKRKR